MTPTPSVVTDDTELILRIARAMKPRLFDPNLSAENCSEPGMVVARDHIFDQARAIIAALPELAASDREVLVKRIDAVRESLRVAMLGQPISGKRRTYNDGFAQGLAEAIRRIDAALIPLGGG